MYWEVWVLKSGVLDLKPYPEYKDSGTKWLGRVPNHWEVVPFKRFAQFTSGVGFPVNVQGDTDQEILFVKVSDMNASGNERHILGAANTVSLERAKELGAKVFGVNTIIFPKVGGALLTNKRRLLVHQTCIDNNLMACIVLAANTGFAFRLLQWLDLGGMAKPGPVPAISEGEVKNIRISLPSSEEQNAIARVLDYVDGQLRRLIEAREQGGGLLEEYRAAAISEAVTGRVDVRTGKPYPDYKPSGIEWLGDIPAHWEIRRLGHVANVQSSNVDKHSREQEIPVLLCNYVDVYKNDAITQDLSFMVATASYVEIDRFQIEAGDVLLTKDSEAWNDIGVASLVRNCEDTVVLGYHCALVRPNLKIVESRYVFRALQSSSVAYQFHVRAKGVTRYGLTLGAMRTTAIPLPPLAEQVAIAEYLDRLTSKIDTAIANTRRELELLEEYRTRMISDVVTGQVDVREAAALIEVKQEAAP